MLFFFCSRPPFVHTVCIVLVHPSVTLSFLLVIRAYIDLAHINLIFVEELMCRASGPTWTTHCSNVGMINVQSLKRVLHFQIFIYTFFIETYCCVYVFSCFGGFLPQDMRSPLEESNKMRYGHQIDKLTVCLFKIQRQGQPIAKYIHDKCQFVSNSQTTIILFNQSLV